MRMEPPEGGATMMDHDAELAAVFARFYGTIWSDGALDLATKEVVRMRSARTIGCETCRNLRFAGPRDEGLTEQLLAGVGEDYASSDLEPRWKIALAWSDAVSGSAADDAPPLLSPTASEFSRPELAELTLQAGLALSFAKAMVAWGPQPDIPVTVVPTPTPGLVSTQPDATA